MPQVRLNYVSEKTALDDLVRLFGAMCLPPQNIKDEEHYTKEFQIKVKSYLHYWTISQIIKNAPPGTLLQLSREEILCGVALNKADQTLFNKLWKRGTASGLLAFTLYNQIRSLETHISDNHDKKAGRDNKPGWIISKEICIQQYCEFDSTYNNRLMNDSYTQFKTSSHLWAGYLWMAHSDLELSTPYTSFDQAAREILLRILTGANLVLKCLSSYTPHGSNEFALPLSEAIWIAKRIEKQLPAIPQDSLNLSVEFAKERMHELQQAKDKRINNK